MFKKYLNLNKFSSLLFYLSILLFIIAFNFAHNPPSGWYQQFLPNLNGAFITDITFTDSLTGYAVTKRDTGNTSYILKTTNGGDNWFTVFNNNYPFTKIQFLRTDINIGFTCTEFGGNLFKTTNAGINWFVLNNPVPGYQDMSVISENEIWVTCDAPFDGGIYRTTDGGQSWEQKFFYVLFNPDKIYMFNSNFGFMQMNRLYRTTNAGTTWDTINNVNEEFDYMGFVDTITGWRSDLTTFMIKKTTDGGLNWNTQTLPQIPGQFLLTGLHEFYILNPDTLWAAGGQYIFPNNSIRGTIFKTTNGGLTWGIQIPDSSIHIPVYQYTNFVNKYNGWANLVLPTGVHSVTGGLDSTIYVGVNNGNIDIPSHFILSQNYPNPFNPNTVINYELRITSYVELKVFNVLGREIETVVNKKQNSGEYKVEFDGSGLSSGIYFYSLFIDGERVDTKKMVLVR